VAKAGLFKSIRVVILLYILLMVAGYSWLSRVRTTDWDNPLYVGIYVVNGDASAVSDNYIASLSELEFQDASDFLSREAARYEVSIDEPARLFFGDPVLTNPPEPPTNGNVFRIALWSLHLRYWAWRHAEGIEPDPDIRIFVRYFDPAKYERLPHSIGLEKGHIGIVNAFASREMKGSNSVVLVHELLHTLGASDKYDLGSGQPLFPHGYAEPERNPLLPQRKTEIMGGRTPLTETEAETPRSLAPVLVGAATAVEIGWID
jgi:hypothetical protein